MRNYLAEHKDFIGGMARCLDLGDTLSFRMEELTPDEADLLAARQDWMAIAEDFKVVLTAIQTDDAETSD